mgnify:CR=1 FL=1
MEFFDKLRECLQACQSPGKYLFFLSHISNVDATQRKNGETAIRQMRDEDPVSIPLNSTKFQ